jgi:hypothetical protein
MLALNFLLRANNIGTSVLVALLYGIQLWRQNGLSKALKKSIWILVGLLMVLAPVTAYFYSLGTLDEMFAASILYNFDYSFQTRPNTGSIQLFQGAILPGHKILRIWMLLPLIGYLLAIYQAAKRFKTKQLSAFDGLLLLAWPVEITASAISGRGYGHYFLLWLPAIGLLSGLLFHYVNQFILSAQFVDLMERRKPILAFMLGFFILGYAFPKPISQNWASAEQILFNRAQGIELQTPIAQYIGQHTTPEETVLVWGGQAGINFLSKRDSSTAYVFYPMLANTRFGKELQNRFYDDLTNRPPSLIVDASLHTPKLAPALDIKVYRNQKLLYPLAENLGDVLDYIDQNYVNVAEVQGYPVYARKSGQINP